MISPLSLYFAERIHLDKVQVVAGILAAYQAFHGQCHSFDVDVLSVISHGSAHIHDDHGRAFGIVSCFVDFDVIGGQLNRRLLTAFESSR